MYYSLPGTNVRILGAMHLFPVSNPTMPLWVVEAEDWAESLVLEAPPESLQQHFKADRLAQLQGQLPSEIWAQLVSFWPTSGPLAPLQDLNAWAAAMIGPQLHMRTVPGVEGFIQASARTGNKQLAYLERAEDVERLFAALPFSDVVSLLRYTLADFSAPQRYLEKLYLHWHAADGEAIANHAAESPLFQIPGLRNAMIVSRNRAWTEWIQGLLSTPHKTLIVVGALHLVGPGNLLECVGHPFETIPLPITAIAEE